VSVLLAGTPSGHSGIGGYSCRLRKLLPEKSPDFTWPTPSVEKFSGDSSCENKFARRYAANAQALEVFNRKVDGMNSHFLKHLK
jgi:hypothetical protein